MDVIRIEILVRDTGRAEDLNWFLKTLDATLLSIVGPRNYSIGGIERKDLPYI